MWQIKPKMLSLPVINPQKANETGLLTQCDQLLYFKISLL